MVNDKVYFSDLIMLDNPIKIAIAKDASFLLATGVGNIQAYRVNRTIVGSATVIGIVDQ